MRDARAARVGEELGTEADQPPRRHHEVKPDPAAAMVRHLLEPPFANREQGGDGAEVLLGHVDGQPFDRLAELAVHLAGHHGRPADRQLVTLPPHGFDQDGQRELAAALHFPGVRPLGRQHADRDVADKLGVKPVAHHPRGDLGVTAARQLRGSPGGTAALRPALADERRGVHADRHRDSRFVHGDQRQRPRVVRVGQRLADHDVADAGDRDDVPGRCCRRRHPLKRLGPVQLGDPDALDGAVPTAPCGLLALADLTGDDPAERDPAQVRRGVQVRDMGTQRRAWVIRRRRHMLPDHVEQRLEVTGVRQRPVVRAGQRGPAGPGRGVEDGELDLVLGRVQVKE